jgi:hypothetical protein
MNIQYFEEDLKMLGNPRVNGIKVLIEKGKKQKEVLLRLNGVPQDLLKGEYVGLDKGNRKVSFRKNDIVDYKIIRSDYIG